jgi:hypothetical protein
MYVCMHAEKYGYEAVPSSGADVDLYQATKIAHISFENVSQLRYLGTAVRNQGFIRNKVRRRLNSDDGCYHSVRNLPSPRLLSKNGKIKIHKTIILPVILYWCETWTLTLSNKNAHWACENKVLRRIFGPKGDEIMVGWRELHDEELHNLKGG